MYTSLEKYNLDFWKLIKTDLSVFADELIVCMHAKINGGFCKTSMNEQKLAGGACVCGMPIWMQVQSSESF